MAENKKSFVLYCDLIHTIEKMPNDKAGLLFKHLLRYVNDQNPIIDDLLIEIAFEPIKRQLKRDLESWEESLIKKGDGGALGNLKRWHLDLYNKVISKELSLQKAVEQSKYRIASHSDKTVSHPIASIAVTVTDTVTDTVTVNVTDIKKDIYRAFAHLKLSNLEFNNLVKAGNSKELIDDILDRIENFAGNKKYKSLYMTCLNWIKTDKGFNAGGVGKKEYLLTSPQGKHKFLFTEDELKAKKLTGYWKEQHEL
jgi:hypothetical protein